MVGMNIAGKVRSQCLYLSEKETNQQTDLSFQSNILNSLLLSVSNIWCQIANSTLYYFLISFSFLGFYSIHFWSSRRNKNWKVSTSTTKKSVKKVTFVQLCLSLALFPLVSTFSSFFFIVPFFCFHWLSLLYHTSFEEKIIHLEETWPWNNGRLSFYYVASYIIIWSLFEIINFIFSRFS